MGTSNLKLCKNASRVKLTQLSKQQCAPLTKAYADVVKTPLHVVCSHPQEQAQSSTLVILPMLTASQHTRPLRCMTGVSVNVIETCDPGGDGFMWVMIIVSCV